MFQVVIKTDVALGNGTRRSGEVIATLNGSVDEWVSRACDGTIKNHVGKAKLSDGIMPCELVNALRNPHICDFVEVVKKVEKPKSQSKSEQK